MLLELLFIYALECGIQGTPTNQTDPVVYSEVEAGVQINDLYLVGTYYREWNLDDYMMQKNNTLKIDLFVDHEGWGFGGCFEYNLETGEDLVTMFARYQSW